MLNVYRTFYITCRKMHLMERDKQTLETVSYGIDYVRTLSNYVRHPQRLHEILECFILPLMLHGIFLPFTPIVMSSYKSTIIQRKSTSLRWCAVLSTLCSKVKKFPPSLPVWRMYLFVKNPGVTSIGMVLKSLGSEFPQALGSVLPLSFVHLRIVLTDPVLASSVPD